ncbi:unnamed protein product [Urochloa humidicola]
MEPPPPASRQRAAAVDRLSDLPDGVLLDVLSRLTFRQAVRTGALSRRWRRLWHAVPYPASCIDIDYRAFRGKDADRPIGSYQRMCRGEDEAQERHFAFLDFGARATLSGADGELLGAFRLRVADRKGFKAAYSWIRRALTRRPMAVAIRCDNTSRHSMDRPEFSFDLYCRGGGAFTFRLRALQLYRVNLEEEFGNAIAGELPVLQDLRLEECHYSFARIASTSLQNLALYNCNAAAFDVNMLALAAPHLTTLRVHGCPAPIIAEGEMASLIAASLEHPASFLGLLGYLHHARKLSLYGFSTAALLDGGGDESRGSLAFRNLRDLYLDECDLGVECQALRSFLRNSPGLETLTLRYCGFSGGSRRRKRKAWSSSDKPVSSGGRRVPTSNACKNLKSVELKYHDDQDVSKLDDALEEISKKAVHPIESSVQHGRRTVRILYE